MTALVFVSGPSAGLRHEIVRDVTLGRSPACEIPLDDDQVSRQHARVRVASGQVWITDLGSRNGTAVNGRRISGEVLLQPGDRLQLGDTTALLDSGLIAAEPGEPANLRVWAVETVLASAANDVRLFPIALSLAGAATAVTILRRTVEQLAEELDAEQAAAFLRGPGGIMPVATVGADRAPVSGWLLQAAMLRGQVASAGEEICAPLGPLGAPPMGVLCARASRLQEPSEVSFVTAVGRLAGERVASLGTEERGSIALVGNSSVFRRMVERSEEVAGFSNNLSLVGGPGSGKSLIARHIHVHSPRALGPLIVVPCAGDPRRVENELLGEEGGAGGSRRLAALVRADGGSLLLQGIESLPEAVAQRLSGFIDRRTAPRFGSGEQAVDVRFLATSSEPLEVLEVKGRLAPGLREVLQPTTLEVPPLRRRSSDVPGLFKFFAGSALRRDPPRLSSESRRLLMAYPWPGNVRELQLIAERLGILYPGLEIPSSRLPYEVLAVATSPPKTLPERILQLEREAILEALRDARGTKIRAAALLGISRPTLDKKIRELALVVNSRERA